MATVGNWVTEATKIICSEFFENGASDVLQNGYVTNRRVEEIIEKCCPFQPDTAYVALDLARELLVGLKRDECWCEVGIGNPNMNGQHSAACMEVSAFIAGTPGKEPPLLECVICHNTESCAGAMARAHWHPGKCAHCGGAFKVIRA